MVATGSETGDWIRGKRQPFEIKIDGLNRILGRLFVDGGDREYGVSDVGWFVGKDRVLQARHGRHVIRS